MLKNKKNIYDTAKTLIFCIFALYVGLREVTVLSGLMGKTIITAGILALGVAVIFVDFFFRGSTLRNRKTDILFVFLCATALSCLINRKYGIGSNVKALCQVVLFYFMLFPAVSGYDKEKRKKLLESVLTTVCILWFVLCSLSVAMYFFSVEYSIIGGSWSTVCQGFSTEYSRLWGIFHDQNYAGFVCLAVILASAYFIKTIKSKLVKVLCAVNILVQLMFITLSGSRSVVIVGACSVFVFVLYSSSDIFRNRKRLLSFVSAVCCSALVVGLIYCGTAVLPVVKKGFEKLPAGFSTAVVNCYDTVYEKSGLLDKSGEESVTEEPATAQDAETTEPATAEPVTDEATTAAPATGTTEPATTEPVTDEATTAAPVSDIEEPTTSAPAAPIKRTDTEKLNDDWSNGRFLRWKQAISIFMKAPVFGTSPRNISEFAKEHNSDTLMAKYGIASHNGYLDILTGTGIVGTAIFAVFFILTIIAIIKKYFLFGGEDDFALATAIAFGFALSALFVSDLFFLFTIGAFSFWFTLGYANECTGDKKEGVLYRISAKILRKDKKKTEDSDGE